MKPLATSLSLAAAALAGCAAIDNENEIDLPLAEVPAVVITAAEAAVPGIVFTAAEIETDADEQVYELTGKKDGVEYEIELSPEGQVLEVESDQYNQ